MILKCDKIIMTSFLMVKITKEHIIKGNITKETRPKYHWLKKIAIKQT